MNESVATPIVANTKVARTRGCRTDAPLPTAPPRRPWLL